MAEHLRPLGIRYDKDVVAEAAEAAEVLGAVRGNAAFKLHADAAPAEEVVDYIARWGLMSRPRAEKLVEFLADRTWRAYVFCYVEGFRLCRSFCSGSASRFERLISEQLLPADLAAAPASP